MHLQRKGNPPHRELMHIYLQQDYPERLPNVFTNSKQAHDKYQGGGSNKDEARGGNRIKNFIRNHCAAACLSIYLDLPYTQDPHDSLGCMVGEYRVRSRRELYTSVTAVRFRDKTATDRGHDHLASVGFDLSKGIGFIAGVLRDASRYRVIDNEYWDTTRRYWQVPDSELTSFSVETQDGYDPFLG
jgi:hypothetical protein